MKALFERIKDRQKTLEKNFGRKMKMNKRGEEGSSVMGIIVALLIALIIILIIFYFLFSNGSWDFFKNLPGNKYDKRDKEIELPLDQSITANYYKVAVIQDGKYIRLCTNNDCNKLRDSNLYWYGSEQSGRIYLDKNWAIDKQIGDVVNSKIKINTEVLTGGNLYIKLQDLLPNYEDLVNLDGSIYISGIIYRDKAVKVDSHEIKEGEVIEKSPEDISNYYSRDLADNGLIVKKLNEPIENSNSETGINTRGVDWSYAHYKKVNGIIYVRFVANHFFTFNDISPWIRMDYWNKYRSFFRVPEKYILKE